MGDRGRAWIRHQAQRLKRKRSGYCGIPASGSARVRGIRARTPKRCSCWMCGHLRKHHGLTLQERKAAQ